MSIDIRVLGDEIWAGDYRVAILSQSGVPATAMAEFEDEIRNWVSEEEACTCEHHEKECPRYRAEDGSPEPYMTAINELLTAVKGRVRNGLVRFVDIEQFAEELKMERVEHEAAAS